jgi:hypothetical protein
MRWRGRSSPRALSPQEEEEIVADAAEALAMARELRRRLERERDARKAAVVADRLRAAVADLEGAPRETLLALRHEIEVAARCAEARLAVVRTGIAAMVLPGLPEGAVIDR